MNIRKGIRGFRTDKNIDINILNQELNRLNLQLKQNKLDDFPRFNPLYNLDRSVSGADFDFDRYNTNHGISLTVATPSSIFLKIPKAEPEPKSADNFPK